MYDYYTKFQQYQDENTNTEFYYKFLTKNNTLLIKLDKYRI